MPYLFSVSSACVVLASLLMAPAFLLPRWAYTSILGGGNLGLWQMFTCYQYTDYPAGWHEMQAVSVMALIANLVAISALVAHVTVVRPEKRKATLRTFTFAAYITVGLTIVLIITFAVIHWDRAAFLSYSFGFTVIGTILMVTAALLGTVRSSTY